jgi:hypothetical protein
VNDDFGSYLVSVQERDIDLLLLEEFHVNADFVSWFCQQLGLGTVQPTGAWHSVSDADGETDLLLRVSGEAGRTGILIENKVGAPEQDLQAMRYHLRGISNREAGRFENYVTVICAPDRYLNSLDPESAYQHQISYEAIAGYFAKVEGPRAKWRSDIFREAIEQGRRGYVMAVSEANTAFHREFYQHLRSNYPQLSMAAPGNKGRYSNWIIMKGHAFPKGVLLHYKLDQSLVELGFSGHSIDEILPRKAHLPRGVLVRQSGKAASLSIPVPSVTVSGGFAPQVASIDVALEAAVLLLDYANLLS